MSVLKCKYHYVSEDVGNLLNLAGVSRNQQDFEIQKIMSARGIETEIHRDSTVYTLYKKNFAAKLLFHPAELYLLCSGVFSPRLNGIQDKKISSFDDYSIAFLLTKLLLEREMKVARIDKPEELESDQLGDLCNGLMNRRAYLDYSRLMNGDNAQQRNLSDLMRRVLEQRLVYLPLNDPKVTDFLETERACRKTEEDNPELVAHRLLYNDESDKAAEAERALNMANIELEHSLARWFKIFGRYKHRREELLDQELLQTKKIQLRKIPGNEQLSEEEVDSIINSTDFAKQIEAYRKQRKKKKTDVVEPYEDSEGGLGMDEYLAYTRRWRHDCRLSHPDGIFNGIADDHQKQMLQQFFEELCEVKPSEKATGKKNLEEFWALDSRLQHYIQQTNLQGKLEVLDPHKLKELYQRLVKDLGNRIKKLEDKAKAARKRKVSFEKEIDAQEQMLDWYQKEITRLEVRVDELNQSYEAIKEQIGCETH